MEFPRILDELAAGRDLAPDAVAAAMRGILNGEWSHAQTAGFLVALKIKGETPAEIAAAARAMREKSSPVQVRSAATAVDTAGTGGDGARAFNVSTAAAFIAAAAGARVAKHGNRAVSGVCGSSDILAALGLDLTLPPAAAASLLDEVGVCFLFAPAYHPAVRHAAPVRKELGVRTLFNLLGPLANPVGAKRQIAGVFSPDLVAPYAQTLSDLGAARAMTFHGDGMDEIALSAETDIAEVGTDGAVFRTTFAPEDAGIKRAPLEAIQVDDAESAKAMFLSAVKGEAGAPRDIAVLNAAAALVVADIATDFADGVKRAGEAADSGAAKKKLDEFLQAAKAKAEQSGTGESEKA